MSPHNIHATRPTGVRSETESARPRAGQRPGRERGYRSNDETWEAWALAAALTVTWGLTRDHMMDRRGLSGHVQGGVTHGWACSSHVLVGGASRVNRAAGSWARSASLGSARFGPAPSWPRPRLWRCSVSARARGDAERGRRTSRSLSRSGLLSYSLQLSPRDVCTGGLVPRPRSITGTAAPQQPGPRSREAGRLGGSGAPGAEAWRAVGAAGGTSAGIGAARVPRPGRDPFRAAPRGSFARAPRPSRQGRSPGLRGGRPQNFQSPEETSPLVPAPGPSGRGR